MLPAELGNLAYEGLQSESNVKERREMKSMESGHPDCRLKGSRAAGQGARITQQIDTIVVFQGIPGGQKSGRSEGIISDDMLDTGGGR